MMQRGVALPLPENERPGETFVICGAAPDTANLGVSALLLSILGGLRAGCPGAMAVIIDHGEGLRAGGGILSGEEIDVSLCGARPSRRYWKSESWSRIRLSASLPWVSTTAETAFRGANAVLDVSGGDSFTDLYGTRRFRAITAPKLFALQLNRPLILLPQTYGPFAGRSARRSAQRILQSSTMAWARDDQSYNTLRALLGSSFDPTRHRRGVDVAFALPKRRPTTALGLIERWLEDRRTPLIGINVSGLILNDADSSKTSFNLKADYGQVIRGLVSRLLAETDARVILIPHVVTPPGHYESDLQASETIKAGFAGAQQPRIAVAPAFSDPRDVKWLIAQMDWFCGTRMHSTIAALSSCVPTAAVAYSDKTLGVFESCGQGKCVADPRSLDTAEMIASLWSAWESRESDRSRLVQEMPRVITQAQDQMQEILAQVQRDPAASIRNRISQ